MGPRPSQQEFQTLLWGAFRTMQRNLMIMSDARGDDAKLRDANAKINAMTNVELIDALTNASAL